MDGQCIPANSQHHGGLAFGSSNSSQVIQFAISGISGGKMLHETPRRQFLKTVGLSALAGAGLKGLGTAMAEGPPVDPRGNTSQRPRLVLGCCAYSYNQELKRGTMTLEDFISKAATKLKVDAVDLTGYYLKSTDPKYLYGLRSLAYKNAVEISGSACGVNMVEASSDKRAESLTAIKKWVDVTAQLGASHLRVFAGELPSGATVKEATGWVVETMKAACDYSAEKGVILGLEDHVGVSQSADVCVEIMHRVNSPYAAINLDITNFIPTPAKDAYTQIAACIPYATNTHIRDRFTDQTPVDMDRVGRLFAQAEFKGYMAVEYERKRPNDDNAEIGVPKLVAKTRELCRKYSSI
jgi:sugar phosphate isomerase/epimerase